MNELNFDSELVETPTLYVVIVVFNHFSIFVWRDISLDASLADLLAVVAVTSMLKLLRFIWLLGIFNM